MTVFFLPFAGCPGKIPGTPDFERKEKITHRGGLWPSAPRKGQAYRLLIYYILFLCFFENHLASEQILRQDPLNLATQPLLLRRGQIIRAGFHAIYIAI